MKYTPGNFINNFVVIILFGLLLAAQACGDGELANPASVYCKEQSGTLEIRTAPDGSQIGYCVFNDNSECEEWSFFRGYCAPGQFNRSTTIANPASVYCEEQGGQPEIRIEDDGGDVGYCIFENGSECEEWSFFRGDCKPGK